jgi:hypothetical protein
MLVAEAQAVIQATEEQEDILQPEIHQQQDLVAVVEAVVCIHRHTEQALVAV